MRRLAAVTGVFLALLTASGARAGDKQGGVRQNGNDDPGVFAISDGNEPPARGSGVASMVCTLHEPVAAGFDGIAPGPRTTSPVEGETYFVVCQFPDGRLFVRQIVYQRGTTVIDSPTLARQAFRLLPLDYPRPSTAPPRSTPQLVGVRTWLWIDPADYRPVTATVEVPGLGVTAVATPVDVRWTMGDGTPTFGCGGPGIAYDPTRPDRDQTTTCSHVFQAAGDYMTIAELDWSVTWTATDGTTGTLPTITRAVSFSLAAMSREAVISS